MKTVEKKVDEIAGIVFSHIIKNDFVFRTGSGLYGGNTGIILFLCSYLNYRKTPVYADTFEKFADGYFARLSEGEFNHTFSSGIAGILYTLRLLNENKLLELDFYDFESAYRDFLLKKMNKDFESGNFDFLHGALGIAFYYKNDEVFIDSVIKHLENTAIKNQGIYKWKSDLGKGQGSGYNIALSHGISSIVIVLSWMYCSGYYREELKKIITGAVNYILSQEIDFAQYGCCFPSQSLENGNAYPLVKSRLAWCYGDLGIAAALWQCGKNLNNSFWKEKALDIMRLSASRKALNENMVWDACLCHGTTGIAMIYLYMHRETNIPLFYDAYIYWIGETVKMAGFGDGLAGYKTYMPMANEWIKDYSLLEGITGTGLVLMSFLKPENCFWPELLLLK